MGEILFPDTPFQLAESLILLGRRGSEAHGTFIPSDDPSSIDDRDLMGICVPPERYYLGLSHWEGADSIKGPWDVCLYELRKFVRLLCKQNPNVVGMLWLEPEDYIFKSEIGERLIANRRLFRHRTTAYHAFCGYAASQLKKLNATEFSGYMGAKRKALVEKHGYDCKSAAHLIRLLHMGREFLQTGEYQVRRTWDLRMLLNIKRGEWPLEQIKDYIAHVFPAVDEAYASSTVPDELDMELIETLVIDCVSDRLRAAH